MGEEVSVGIRAQAGAEGAAVAQQAAVGRACVGLQGSLHPGWRVGGEGGQGSSWTSWPGPSQSQCTKCSAPGAPASPD